MSAPTVHKLQIYFSIPYYGYITDLINNDLKNLIQKYYPQIDLNLIPKNSLSINSFFKHKEKLPDTVCSCVIYEYRCSLCNERYIGSTIRQLSLRIAEHMGVSVRTNLPLSTTPNSAIYKHESETGHRIIKSNFKIISFNNKQSLRTLEALYIFKTKPKMNCGLPVELSLVC